MPEIDNPTLVALATRVGDLADASDALRQYNFNLVAGSTTDPDSFDADGKPSTDPTHGPLGYYPVINGSGGTVYFPCWARWATIAGGTVAEFAAAAEAAATAAAASVASIGTSVADAQAAATAAAGSATTANTKAGEAAASATAAGNSATAAAASKTQAETARDLVEAKRAEVASNAALAYGYQQSAAAAVAYQNLSLVALSKAVSAVGLFVYDTSKDSDGGAWRKRCQHTAYYNEPLNTTFRGARREFPAVALIVLIDASNVLVYDLDDPAAPMWGNLRWAFPSYGATVMTKVRALNGRICIASNAGYGGLAVIDLAADRNTWYGLGQGGDPSGIYVQSGWSTVTPRPQLSTANATIGQAFVNAFVNDIDMTVMPDAPIDPASRLPIPTIAVATNAGASIIHPDGSVADWVPASSAICERIVIRPGFLAVAGGGGIAYRVWMRTSIPTADSTSFDFRFAADSTPARLGLDGTTGRVVAQSKYRNTLAMGLAFSGVNLLLPNEANFAGSMVAYISYAYNSGWMVGAVKGAWLASKDATALVATNVITSTFTGTSNFDGWTIDPAATDNAGVDILDVTAASYTIATRTLTGLTIGAAYMVRFERIAGTQNCFMRAGVVYQSAQSATAGFDEFTFVATATTQTLEILAANATLRVKIDNITVDLATADRSGKARGMRVNGTVTRAAVAAGAELVGYSGFSASNYLEQAYNPALDFGTGDFCVMGWFKKGVSAARHILDRRKADDSDDKGRLSLLSGADNKLSASAFDNAGVNIVAITGATAIDPNIWTHYAFVRFGSVAYLYVNGVIDATDATASGNIAPPAADATLVVGGRHDHANSWPGSLALLRIGATPPSPAQIRKIYEDERELFQPGAACTLYGGSDVVAAVTHDQDNGLLHIGTSAGRSVFQGLRRVANTTNAVGATISAANNLVADD
nr:LamG domain-containing protein [Sphingomonas sp. Y57]